MLEVGIETEKSWNKNKKRKKINLKKTNKKERKKREKKKKNFKWAIFDKSQQEQTTSKHCESKNKKRSKPFLRERVIYWKQVVKFVKAKSY